MLKYVYRRLLQLIPILIGITVINFGIMFLSPSDPAERELVLRGMMVSQETLDAMRADLGLDRPFWVQYGHWTLNLLRGDLGNSYASGRPVMTEIRERLPHTISLAAGAMLMTMVVSIPLGLLAAVRQNGIWDYLIRVATFVGGTMPGFLVGLLLIYVFALRLNWQPVISDGSLRSMILPVITLALAMTCKYIRQIRAAILEELDKEYVWGARARGVKEKYILYRNVLKNSMLTIITLVGLSVGYLLGGTAIVEIIFTWPGMGKLVMDAINMRDYPVVQGYVIWMAIIFVSVNLLTDLSYRFLNPRIRLSNELA
ncbi:MAG: ABC transporter permease [Deltaproteobacteria bacterium]|nr:ABC transporter permease [Deltaproteobacteria bacterium]